MRREIFGLIFFTLLNASISESKTFVRVSNPYELKLALKDLQNNSTLLLSEGVYRTPLKIFGKKNITLIGSSAAPTIVKGSKPIPDKISLIRSDLPVCKEQPFLEFCRWRPSLK